MRISKKQAELLAEEVANKLQKMQQFKVSSEVIKKVHDFKKARARLVADKNKVEKELSALDDSFNKMVNNMDIRCYWSAEDIIKKMEKGKKPNIQKIADKIVLKAMFTDSESLEKFVQDLVKEFSKEVKEYVS